MPSPQKFSSEIFFRYFPKVWFIVIVVGLVLKIIAPGIYMVWNFMINLALTVLFFRISTFIHEAGHLLGAKLVGGIPRRMVLGTGHEIYRTEAYGVKVILNSSPLGGLAYATFDKDSFIKWRYAMHIAGGVLFNLIVAAIFAFIFGMEPRYLFGDYGVDITSAFIFTNAIMITNLIPIYTSFYGLRQESDGLILLKLPFKPNAYFKDMDLKNQFFDAYEHLENREYDKANAIFKRYHEKFPDEAIAVMNIGIVYLKSGEIDEAFNLMKSLEQKADAKELIRFKPIIYNNLAWVYLIKDKIEEAYHYATIAFKMTPNLNYVRGTYGSILIAKGELDSGMKSLYQNMDVEHPNTITLTASMFLMLAYHLKDNMKARDHHLNFVLTNLDKLEKDDQILLKRNLLRMGVELPANL